MAGGSPHQFENGCFPRSYNYTSVRSDGKREWANALCLNHLVLFMWTDDQQMPPPCLKHSTKFGFTKCISFHVFFFTVTGQGGSRANTSDLYSGSAQFNSWLGPQLYYTEASRYFLRSTTMRHCHKFGQTTSFHTPHNSLFANHPTVWCLRSQLLTVLLNTP